MRRERIFQVTFSHWLKEVYKQTACFELKQSSGNSIPFSAVVPHQVEALLAVRHKTFVFKIPDAGFQNPFDCFCMTKMPAYVVLKYPDFFCLISIDTFLKEREESKRKSLTARRAEAISVKVVKM